MESDPKMNAGIYQIQNLVNWKRYIGSAIDINRRWGEHRRRLLCGTHVNKHLQSAWNKYGSAQFSFKTLLICTPEQLLIFEQICFKALNPEYNKTPTAGSSFGYKHSEETKQKLRNMKLGVKLSYETRLKMSRSSIGKRKTKATKEKMSIAGKLMRERNLANLQVARFAPSRKGVPLSLETRAKMSAKAKLRPDSYYEKMRSGKAAYLKRMEVVL